MNWPKFYIKNSELDLIKDFVDYLIYDCSLNVPIYVEIDPGDKPGAVKFSDWISGLEIRDLYGYIVTFAETKGIAIVSGSGNYMIQRYSDAKQLAVGKSNHYTTEPKKMMEKCAEEFFGLKL
ncbi:MAG: hypothetical protein GWP19_09610 [Planctomycetia bacterium]|nr:hypothetical protein [Planctomycetia bacterium]